MKFSELLDLNSSGVVSDDVVDKAKQNLGEINTDYGWDECVVSVWKEAMESIGLMGPEISYTGFWSQGDGASFTTEWVDISKLIEFLGSDIPKINKIDFDGDKEDFKSWLCYKANGYQYNPNFKKLLLLQDDINLKILRDSHHYSHENTCSVDKEVIFRRENFKGYWEKDCPRLKKLIDDFFDAVEQLRLDFSRAIYKDLEEHYNFLQEDTDSLKELAEANDYEFDSFGNFI